MGMGLPCQEGEGKWKGDMMFDLVSVGSQYIVDIVSVETDH